MYTPNTVDGASVFRLPHPLISRFAPSITGFLHIGHVAHMAYLWGFTHSQGGLVRLRFEDHDSKRYRPEYEKSIVEDMQWLGFRVDEDGGKVLRQSERHETYEKILSQLRGRGLVYACECSRRDIQAQAGMTRSEGEEVPYQNVCRHRGLAEGEGRSVRLVFEPGPVTYRDLVGGLKTEDPALRFGDLMIRDRHGDWTYQFAATVDDIEQGITLVVRGDDIEPSTARQVALASLIGRETPPVFLHHPLILDRDGRKLSKRDNDTGVRELREAGWEPERVLGLACFRVGLISRDRPVHAEEVVNLFLNRLDEETS
ncbi:MAG: glutamate--tRNA ligase family protein [Gemmatimonadota bacterium]|nr:glutamate--tRNA ligase family protein [Gemmatimonadota bacterium]